MVARVRSDGKTTEMGTIPCFIKAASSAADAACASSRVGKTTAEAGGLGGGSDGGGGGRADVVEAAAAWARERVSFPVAAPTSATALLASVGAGRAGITDFAASSLPRNPDMFLSFDATTNKQISWYTADRSHSLMAEKKKKKKTLSARACARTPLRTSSEVQGGSMLARSYGVLGVLLSFSLGNCRYFLVTMIRQKMKGARYCSTRIVDLLHVVMSRSVSRPGIRASATVRNCGS